MALPTAASRALSRADALISAEVSPGSVVTFPGTRSRIGSLTPTAPVRLAASATQEYVAGTPQAAALNVPRALPWALDDVARDFGDDIYDRMRNDAKIASNLIVLKSGVLEDGATLTPAIADKEADGYAQAAAIADECTAMLDALTPSLDDALWMMLEGLEYGHKVAELVYRVDASPTTGQQRLLLDGIRPKPRRATAFVVDSRTRLLGLLALVPGMAYPVQNGALVGLQGMSQPPNLLPREKFLVFTFRGRDGDPRGTSLLRPAFSPWNAKYDLIGDYLAHMKTFGSPSLVGTTAEGAQDVNGLSPQDMQLLQLEMIQNGGVLSLPFGASVTPLTVDGQGSNYLAGIDYWDKMITFAMLQQTLATEEGRYQTRAASGGQKDILDTVIRQIKKSLCRALRHDVLTPYVRYNYGDDAATSLVPHVHLGTIAAEDRTDLMAAIAGYVGQGCATLEQMVVFDTMLGLPPRDADSTPFIPAKAAPAPLGQMPQDEGDMPPPDPAQDDTDDESGKEQGNDQRE